MEHTWEREVVGAATYLLNSTERSSEANEKNGKRTEEMPADSSQGCAGEEDGGRPTATRQ